MGLSPFSSCRGGYSTGAPAPNPDPSRWSLVDVFQYEHGHVLVVKYHDCTNFEGVKVMVYRGEYSPRRSLDPHFSDGPESPVARFRPDAEGLEMAKALAQGFRASASEP